MECPAAVDGHEDWLGLVDGFAAVALMNRGLTQGGLPLKRNRKEGTGIKEERRSEIFRDATSSYIIGHCY